MKGLGKTRLLEEWPAAFHGAGVTSAFVAVTEEDNHLPFTASFAWSMLHQWFVKQNLKDEQSMLWTSSSFLPGNARKMNLSLALAMIQALLQEFLKVPSDGICFSFTGVDECKSILEGRVHDEKRKAMINEHQKTAKK